MKRAYFICLFQLLTATFLLSQSNPVHLIKQSTKVVSPISASQADPKDQAKILDRYGKLPLTFEANQGQADARVKFLSRTSDYSLFLTSDEAVLTLHGKKAHRNKPKIAGAAHAPKAGMEAPEAGGVLRMKLRNANSAAKVTGADQLAATSNYFIGNDPAKWRTNVPTYAKVKYERIYSGIDLVYYGNQRQLEYDFIVAPGADPRRIVFDVSGAKRIRQDAHGDLVLKMGGDEIRWHKPVVYQEKGGARQQIAAHYAVTERNRVGFELAKYDSSKPLYIDPLIYSTYLGGSDDEEGYSIAVDSLGNAYVTGITFSTDFPTKNPLQPAFGGGILDAFVAKINAAGSALVYSTYLGGSAWDEGDGIAVDSVGNAYVTGQTQSTDFPTMSPLQAANGGGYDAFVTKINAAGSALIYSTYLGGSGPDSGNGIAADSAGNAYVTGSTSSTDFPTMNPLQAANSGEDDAFVTKINAAGSALIYSTYLGGSGSDGGHSIAVDSAGDAYIAGGTSSTDFPTRNPLQAANRGGGDTFVSEINPTGSALVYSTYLGGSGDDSNVESIAVDSAGNAYITGATSSTDFPTKNPLQPTYGGGGDAFVTKINPTGTALVYSTYLGGSDYDKGFGIAVNSAGDAYVTGTAGPGFPTTPGAFQRAFAGGDEVCACDAFVTKINPKGSALVYSTYLGGSGEDDGFAIAVDSAGDAYVTGDTESDFPVTPGAFQRTYGGGGDDFVTKIHTVAGTKTTTTLSSSPNPSTYGQSVTLTATVTSSLGAPPDGETVTFMKGTTVLGTGALSSGSASFTTSTLKVGTNTIKAVYAGDSNFAGSKSKAVPQVVNKATTTTTLASSLNPSNFGQPVTFTASVAPQFSGTVKGTVTFYDGTTALKTASLSAGAAKYTTKTLTHGTHTITATYNGNASFDGSSASLTQTVN